MTNSSARWSLDLRLATEAAIKDWSTLPLGDGHCFKHVSAGFGTIDFAALMRGDLRMIIRDTDQVLVFANADELIAAGWALD